MEEKNTVKISLSTFLLLLAIIVIVIMAYFIYKLNNEKISETEKVADLNAQVSNLEGTVNNLQDKFNNISNTINSTNTSNNTSNKASDASINNETTVNQSNTNNQSKSSVDKIAKELFEKGSLKIRETEYTDYYEYERSEPIVEKDINGIKYQKRNVLYSDIEKKYSEIFTGEALKKVLNKRFAEVDGYLYVSYGGATGWGIANVKVSRISESNNEIKYTVKYNNLDAEDRISNEESCDMTVTLINGNYRISSTNYCNI